MIRLIAFDTSEPLPPQSELWDQSLYEIELDQHHAESLELALGLTLEPSEYVGEYVGTGNPSLLRIDALAHVERRRAVPISRACSAAQILAWTAAVQSREWANGSAELEMATDLAGAWQGLAITYVRGLAADGGTLTFERRHETQPVVVMSAADAARALSTISVDAAAGNHPAVDLRSAADRWLAGRSMAPFAPTMPKASNSREIQQQLTEVAQKYGWVRQEHPLRLRVQQLSELAAWAVSHAAGRHEPVITWPVI